MKKDRLLDLAMELLDYTLEDDVSAQMADSIVSLVIKIIKKYKEEK